MRTIIAGSRFGVLRSDVDSAMRQCGWTPTVVISGGATGADRLGESWARDHNKHVYIYPAEWDRYGKQAGFVRNVKMAEQADALVAIWDGRSNGTRHMINTARDRGLRVYFYHVDP